MKFKDNLLGKYLEFKQENEFVYELEDCLGNDSHIYKFDIGIYVILEFLFEMVLNPPKNKVLIKLEYSNKEYEFNNAQDTLDFLLDKDTSKLNNFSVERKKTDFWFGNYFIFDYKKGIVKEFMSKRI